MLDWPKVWADWSRRRARCVRGLGGLLILGIGGLKVGMVSFVGEYPPTILASGAVIALIIRSKKGIQSVG